MIKLNADTGGAGDVALLTWFVQGYNKEQGEGKAVWWAKRPDRLEILRLFGQPITDDPRGSIATGGTFPPYHYELSIDRGQRSRLEVWSRQLAKRHYCERPPLVLLPKEEENGKRDIDKLRGKRPCVLLFPFCDWAPRQWPLACWNDLAWKLHREGVAVAAMCDAGRKDQVQTFPFIFWGLSWSRVAAMMKESSLVAAADTGPAHIAAGTGVKVQALMGPTKNIFAHADNVEEMAASVDDAPCVGCYFQGDKGFRAACDIQCQALFKVEVPQVFDRIMERINA